MRIDDVYIRYYKADSKAPDHLNNSTVMGGHYTLGIYGIIPLPTSAWMGLVLLTGTAVVGLIRSMKRA